MSSWACSRMFGTNTDSRSLDEERNNDTSKSKTYCSRKNGSRKKMVLGGGIELPADSICLQARIIIDVGIESCVYHTNNRTCAHVYSLLPVFLQYRCRKIPLERFLFHRQTWRQKDSFLLLWFSCSCRNIAMMNFLSSSTSLTVRIHFHFFRSFRFVPENPDSDYKFYRGILFQKETVLTNRTVPKVSHK